MLRLALIVSVFFTVVVSKSTWLQHGVPLTCDVSVCSYVIIENQLPNRLENGSLEMISGRANGNPANIPSNSEELIFMKKEPFVAVGVVGTLHYRVDDYNATVMDCI